MQGLARLLGMPPDISAHGSQIDALIGLMHVFMFVLFIGWTVFFVYVIVRFSRTRNPESSYTGTTSHVNRFLEIGVVVVEVILLVGLSVPYWIRNIVAEPPDDAVTIRVVAQQFAWNVHYPGADGEFGQTSAELVDSQTNPIGLDRNDVFGQDDITTVNQLHIPVGVPVEIELTSMDVVHNMFLPQLRIKQDAIPGMIIPVHFTALAPGEFEIACAQLCGIGHFRMRGFYTVENIADYQSWLAAEAVKLAEEQSGGIF